MHFTVEAAVDFLAPYYWLVAAALVSLVLVGWYV